MGEVEGRGAGQIEQVLDALNRAGVRYLVVGGVAVVLHGRLRTTVDLDLVVQLHKPNRLRAVEALEALGYHPRAPVSARDFADETLRDSWIREKGMTVFSLWSSRFRGLEVDLFASVPFDFDEVYARSITVSLEHADVTVIGIDDLIRLKESAGRPQDILDVEALRAIREPRVPGESEEDRDG